MKFYWFMQNNSGGLFTMEENKFDINVLIEAETADAANIRAQEVGIYFDPECEIDCECCGSRWDEVNEYNGYDSLMDALRRIQRYHGHCVIHYANGRTRHIKSTPKRKKK